MIILFISDNKLLFDSITPFIKNAQCFLVNHDRDIASFLKLHNTADVLILDNLSNCSRSNELTKVSRLVVDISDSAKPSAMSFIKPFRLKAFLRYIQDISMHPELFCVINERVIYDERASTLRCDDEIIKLTEKENQLIKSLLHAPKFTISKDDILKKIWGYASDTQTSTIDTYVSRIRNKLPKDLIIIGIDSGNVILYRKV